MSNYDFNDVKPCTSRDANLFSNLKISNSSQNIQETQSTRPKRSFLTLSTNGFGLVESETEEEKRKREQDEISYELFSQKRKTNQENYKYVDEYKDCKEGLKETCAHLNNSSYNHLVADFGSDFVPLLKPKEEFEDADENDLEIYHNSEYNLLNPTYNSSLPIYKCKERILNSLNVNNVVIIQGNTGCGKTTQVPQYILDHYASINKKCNIIVTQPRRLAAISIAKRICEEREWNLGSICGYRIAREAKMSPLTRISFVTTGYLVAQAIGLSNVLNSYTHIILDEVHDRELDIDLILLIVRLLLMAGYKGKLLLMSATLDPHQLKCYFESVDRKTRVDIINCSYEFYKVREYYLDDMKKFLNPECVNIPIFNINEPKMMYELIVITGELLKYFDDKEIENNKDKPKINGFLEKRGSVLIFVPGMDEIRRVEEYLKVNMEDRYLSILPLHSDIALEQQMEVFKRAQGGYRKVIISTSIAESSITVGDIKYVIDFCLTKSLYSDVETNLTELKLEWAAISNLNQRRGRAGRVEAGSCYRLVTKEFFKRELPDFAKPEILRHPLDKLVLSVKRLDSRNKPAYLLSKMLTPPESDKIERAILLLKEIGALTLYKNKRFCSDDGEITFAGKIISQLPIDLRLGKLILFGHVFGRLKSAIIIAAALSTKCIFTKNYKSDFEFYHGKLNWSNGLFCDYNAIVNAYKVFETKQKEMSKYELKMWTKDNMLDYSRLLEVKKLVEKIEGHLKDLNLINQETEQNDEDFQHVYKSTTVETEQDAINECYMIKFIVAGAFYPNYFYTSQASEEDAFKSLSGKNPKTTVCVRGFDDLPALYHSKILELFSICSQNMIIHYEQYKAFVEFKKSSDIITKVSLGVYLALFLKKIKRNQLGLFKIKKGKEYAKRQLEIVKANENIKYETNILNRITVDSKNNLSDPNLLIKDLNEFYVKIIYSDQIGHFYAQIDDQEHDHQLESINGCLSQKLFEVLPQNEIKVGMLVATLTFESLEKIDFVRARIDKINQTDVEVFYIDYGNSEDKDFNLLFKLPNEISEIPYQALSCSLINMKVNDLKMLNKRWHDRALGEFSNLLKDNKNNQTKKLKAKIFSIIENNVRLSLFEVTPVAELDISKKMLKLELVESCEETEQSKRDNNHRFNTCYIKERSQRLNSDSLKITNTTISDALEEIEFEESIEKSFEIKVENPLKVNLNCMTRALNKISNISISTDSCNHILLDDEPETNSSSLVVTHHFMRRSNDEAERLYMRETCLFSKLKGIVSFCLMVFSPYSELRIDRKNKKYTGVLCGLGFDKVNGRPICTDNDIENQFEYEFDQQDFNKINAVRFCVNALIGDEERANKIMQEPDKLKKVQMDNRKFILELFTKNRNPITNPVHYRNEYRWNDIPEKWYHEKNSIQIIEKNHMNNKCFYMGIRTIDFSKVYS